MPRAIITSTLADKLEELDDLIKDLENDRDSKDLRIAELEHGLEEANDRIADLMDKERIAATINSALGAK